ncbi:DUF4041 domain-containing protein [Nocardia heshunensis]
MNSAPPDWYPDPRDEGFLRWWNGSEWTGDLRPARAGQSPSGLELTALQREREQLNAEITDKRAELDGLRAQVIHTSDELALQEIGIYEYRHPLTDAVTRQEELRQLRGNIKYLARLDGGAIEAPATWMIGDSVTQGRKMIREYSMLMLRAYNAEVDNLVRDLKPWKLPTALERLDKIATALERFGQTMKLRIAPQYHGLRRRELEMTADHLEEVARRKQKEREDREKLREERKVHEELARKRAALERQQEDCRTALTSSEATGDTASADDLRKKLSALEEEIKTVDYRATHVRAGYVYVISNLGAFGKDVVKIGLTRRFDPYERIRELNIASVPFRFDVHALFPADDAVGIEAEMHRRLDRCRVNRVNNRREFFRVPLAEVRRHLQEVAPDELLEFTEFAAAEEFRRSENVREED